jgi:hypothetical protein
MRDIGAPCGDKKVNSGVQVNRCEGEVQSWVWFAPRMEESVPFAGDEQPNVSPTVAARR